MCCINVLHRVRHHGGRRVNGWIIWESQPLDEAEFHCVWESPEGSLVLAMIRGKNLLGKATKEEVFKLFEHIDALEMALEEVDMARPSGLAAGANTSASATDHKLR